jgi:Anti-sigma-K factor rskA
VSSDPDERALAPLLGNPAVWAEVPAGFRDRVLAEALAARAEQGEIELDDDLHGDEPSPATERSPDLEAGPRGPDDVAGGGEPGLADLRARMLAEASAGGGETGGGGGGVVTPLEGGRRRRARAAWRRPAMLAAAAAVTFALGIAGGLALNRGDEAPKGAEVALGGTDAMPAASATVHLDDQPSGVSVTLDVEGLPPAPDGTFYEAWLIGKNGKVSAGTFHLREPQDHIRLWLGVDPDGYDAITVTRQPVVGGSKADGVVLLRGPLHPG